jgi:hypothetical protein
MPTLHIEHPITDFGARNSAFARFAEAQRQAGVRGVARAAAGRRPNYVVVDLDFGTHGEAEAFLRFLTAQVWGVPQNAPALAGTPQIAREPWPGTSGRVGTARWCSMG